MTDNEKKAAAAVVAIGLWLRSRGASANTSEVVILDEPPDGSARPSADGRIADAGTDRGLAWVIWTEPSTPGYRTVWHSVRNSIGQLIHYGSSSSYADGDVVDFIAATENERESIVQTIDAISG